MEEDGQRLSNVRFEEDGGSSRRSSIVEPEASSSRRSSQLRFADEDPAPRKRSSLRFEDDCEEANSSKRSIHFEDDVCEANSSKKSIQFEDTASEGSCPRRSSQLRFEDECDEVKECDGNSAAVCSKRSSLIRFADECTGNGDQFEDECDEVKECNTAAVCSKRSSLLHFADECTGDGDQFEDDPMVSPIQLPPAFVAMANEAFSKLQAVSSTPTLSIPSLCATLKQEPLSASILFRDLTPTHDGLITSNEWVTWFCKLYTKGGIEEAMSHLTWIESHLDDPHEPSEPTPTMQPQPPPPMEAHEREALFAKTKVAFDEIDAKCSKDGEVSRDELLRVLKQERLGAKILFHELDTNSDGGISLTEWNAWFERLATRGGVEEAETRLEWIQDRLKTCGEIATPEEVSLGADRIHHDIQKMEELFKKTKAAFDEIDAKCSKDGEVSRDELLRVLKQERLGAKILFHELDTNSDGGISLTEWNAWFERLATRGGVEEAETRLEWIEDRLKTCGEIATPEEPALSTGATRIAENNEAVVALKKRVAAAFDEIDAKCSKDGEVSRDELLRVLKQERLGAKVLFHELDTNSDGGISLTEWNAWFNRLREKGGIPEAETRLEWIEDRLKTCCEIATPEELCLGTDRIHHDIEAREELFKKTKAAFDEIDAKCSKDGEVSRDELLRVLKQERLGAKILFHELDTNSDGGISLTEWNAWFERLATRGGVEEAETRLEWIQDRLTTCDQIATPETVSLGADRIHHDIQKMEELFKKTKAAFDEIDAKCSKDGEVSRDELLRVLKQERLGAKILFHELDTNSDGGISLTEWNAWFERLATRGGVEEAETRLEWIGDRLKTCDKIMTPDEAALSPGVSRIARDEAAWAALKQRSVAAFDEIDAKCSKDGEVSRDELLRVLKQERLGAKVLFRELDTNSDGGISLTEWNAWFEKLATRGGVEDAETRLEWIEDRLKTCNDLIVNPIATTPSVTRVSIGRKREENAQALTLEGMQIYSSVEAVPEAGSPVARKLRSQYMDRHQECIIDEVARHSKPLTTVTLAALMEGGSTSTIDCLVGDDIDCIKTPFSFDTDLAIELGKSSYGDRQTGLDSVFSEVLNKLTSNVAAGLGVIAAMQFVCRIGDSEFTAPLELFSSVEGVRASYVVSNVCSGNMMGDGKQVAVGIPLHTGLTAPASGDPIQIMLPKHGVLFEVTINGEKYTSVFCTKDGYCGWHAPKYSGNWIEVSAEEGDAEVLVSLCVSSCIASNMVGGPAAHEYSADTVALVQLASRSRLDMYPVIGVASTRTELLMSFMRLTAASAIYTSPGWTKIADSMRKLSSNIRHLPNDISTAPHELPSSIARIIASVPSASPFASCIHTVTTLQATSAHWESLLHIQT